MASKSLERTHLDRFIERVGWDCAVTEGEEPDFIVHRDSITFGVEHTQLFKDKGRKGSQLKADEIKNSDFLTRIAKSYYSRGGKPISVTANIVAQADTREETAVVDSLLAFTTHLQAGGHGRHQLRLNGQTLAILYVNALSDKMGNYSCWRCVNNSLGWVVPITEGAICQCIAHKARRLHRYHARIQETVLLIVADRTRASGMLRFDPGSEPFDPCGFAEAYLLIFPSEAHRIACKNP